MMVCEKCGVELAPGGSKYLVTIHVTADLDGVLPSTGTLDDLEAFMQQIDGEDPVTLEKDVYLTQAHVLCSACKKAFLENPLGLARRGETPFEGGRLH